MGIRQLFAALAAVALSLAAPAADIPLDTPLVVDGPIKVDAGDLEGFMLRVPEQHRAPVRADPERVATMVDNIFIARTLAAKARAAGLDKDPAVQRRMVQVQEALLADLYMQHLEKTAPVVDLEPRARELYLADPKKYTRPERVHVQHILVDLNGRTREMARERAMKFYEDIRSGKEDFLAIAARYSDASDKERNGGDPGYGPPNAFVEPVAKRIAQMTKKGEVSEPIESHAGFHIVRFMDRRQPELVKFEEVKKGLVAAEKELIAKKRHEDLIREIRSSKTVTVYRDNVDKLVTPLPDMAKAAAAEAAASEAKDKPAR